MYNSLPRYRYFPAALAGLAALTGCLFGCGSSSSTTSSTTGTTLTPQRQVHTFLGPDPGLQAGQNGTFTLGRSFITLQDGVPQEIGMMLTDQALDDQKPTPISDDQPNIYPIQLPQEAIAATPFRFIGIFYFTGHPIDIYRPNGEPQHLHCVFLLNEPVENAQPPFAVELKTPAPEEVPVGSPRGVPDTFVPGLGVSYDDPTKPVGQPARITIGQNFLFYNGHLNAMAVGEDVSLLKSHQSESDVVDQPLVYPRAGYYPTKWHVRYDALTNTHVLSLTDFIKAQKYVTQ